MGWPPDLQEQHNTKRAKKCLNKPIFEKTGTNISDFLAALHIPDSISGKAGRPIINLT
jgi:hypothetical protein